MTNEYEYKWLVGRWHWSPKELSELIDWRIAAIRTTPMQRMFTIELKVDYADKDKNQVMREACQKAARHMLATASLLSDGVKPQVVSFSDDHFDGHALIPLFDDVIKKGEDELTAAGVAEEEAVSPELMAALKG